MVLILVSHILQRLRGDVLAFRHLSDFLFIGGIALVIGFLPAWISFGVFRGLLRTRFTDDDQ